MKLVDLAEFRNRELVAVLEELTELVRSGQASGIAFVVKLGRGEHRIGLAGDYRRRPNDALEAAANLHDFLLQDFDEAKESGT